MTELIRPHPGGAVLTVRASPGASAAAIVGVHGHELRVRVCSPPVDGRANEEVVKVIAGALGLRTRQVQMLSGHTGRSKQVVVALAPAVLMERLLPWIGPEMALNR